MTMFNQSLAVNKNTLLVPVSFCVNEAKDHTMQGWGWCWWPGSMWSLDMSQIMLQDFFTTKDGGFGWFILLKKNHGRCNTKQPETMVGIIWAQPWWPNKIRVSINTQLSKKRHSTHTWFFKVNSWLLKLDWRRNIMTPLLDIAVKTWVSMGFRNNINPENIWNILKSLIFSSEYSLVTLSKHFFPRRVSVSFNPPAHLQACHRLRSARCLAVKWGKAAKRFFDGKPMVISIMIVYFFI